MSMKRTDLAKNLGHKITGKMNAAGIPGRFAAEAAAVADRHEQRRQERALGLIPFACKLPADLVKQLQVHGGAHENGINGLMAELIAKALADVA